MESHKATEIFPSNDHNESNDANIELHLATWNLTLSGPGRPDHTSWPRTAAQRLSPFLLFLVFIFFLLPLLWMIPTLRSGFGKDTCGFRINSTLRINIDINGTILFWFYQGLPRRLQTIS